MVTNDDNCFDWYMAILTFLEDKEPYRIGKKQKDTFLFHKSPNYSASKVGISKIHIHIFFFYAYLLKSVKFTKH